MMALMALALRRCFPHSKVTITLNNKTIVYVQARIQGGTPSTEWRGPEPRGAREGPLVGIKKRELSRGKKEKRRGREKKEREKNKFKLNYCLNTH